MILAKATLVAGPSHAKYASGSSLPAILFIQATTEDEAERVAARELTNLGWATMTIEAYKQAEDHDQFDGAESAEAGAFQDALATGFGVVVYP